MKKHFPLLILLVSLGSIYAQAINITGKVIDNIGRGLSGATVKLVAQKLQTVTGVDGSFSINKNVGIVGSQSNIFYQAPFFKNGVLHFSLDRTQKVAVSLHDLNGRLIWVRGQELVEPGVHDIITPVQYGNTQLFLVKAVIGDKQFQFKSFNLLRSATTHNRQAVVQCVLPSLNDLNKTLVVIDSLKTSLSGYPTTSVPVSAYTGFYTITLGAIAPVITSQPSNQSVLAGQMASFSVTATGSNLTYQWQKNDTNISSATTNSYTTKAVTTADSGAMFKCVVTNTAGSIKSNSAVLTVRAYRNPFVVLNTNQIVITCADKSSCFNSPDYSNPTVTVYNGGDGVLSFKVSESINWLSCSPISGSSTGIADSKTITITILSGYLGVGTYVGHISIANQLNQSIDLAIIVVING